MKDSIENSGEKQCDGNPVDLILSHPELGEGARILLYWLWRLCGGRPNRILTNKHHLASLTRRDLRTIEGNLKRLKGAGRIDFDWDKARGGKKPRYRVLLADLEKFEAVSPTPAAPEKASRTSYTSTFDG